MISTKGRYALRVMLDLAENSGDEESIPLRDIAERQQISKKYLEAIMKDLVKGKLVKGNSGKGGGYRLCRHPDEYTVGEILALTEASLASVACLSADADACPRASCCKTLPMWIELDRTVHDFLNSKKLSDLL